ncbi:MAG TPA: hypothetical protein VEB64_18380 [Azospirillaceae bacterium]|nr:hypothetical protein [Azospirillaceae bacterium]
MPIDTEAEFEQAIQEFQRLRDAPEQSPEGRRRAELDAEIKAYYQLHASDLRPSRPVSQPYK